MGRDGASRITTKDSPRTHRKPTTNKRAVGFTPTVPPIRYSPHPHRAMPRYTHQRFNRGKVPCTLKMSPSDERAQEAAAPPATPAVQATAPRLWPAAAIVALFWLAYAIAGMLDLDNFTIFISRFAAVGALGLLFTLWYLFSRTARLSERLAVLAIAVLGGVIAILILRHPRVLPPALLYYAIPAIATGWAVWLLATRRATPAVRRGGMLAIPVLIWAATALVRMDGLSGAGQIEFFWRWSATGEEQFLADRAGDSAPARPPRVAPGEPLVAADGDWPRFRGPDTDGARRGVTIATDWDDAPPKLRWRRRIGPGWSSLTVVDGRLFTQEQRGEREAVVCLDAATGDELWSHEDAARFSEELGGDGPRATPTFADGKLLTLGATGILNCFDAATGDLQWTQNIAPAIDPAIETNDDSTPQPPYWGYASSPLVVGDAVVVFAGGHRDDSLRAHSLATGKLLWKANSGKQSYSSPQLATFDGEQQVLYLSDLELTAVDPQTGENRWRFEAGFEDGFPSIQPHLVGEDQVLVSFAQSAGTMLLRVARDDGAWEVTPVWKERDLKPYFNDFVRHDGALFGFDGDRFACVDAATGKRHWKRGRYGSGQVLLLADQGVLVVLSETGEVVLVAADPAEHRELARFQAIEGKTWNHPTIVGDRLYVRNAEEIACYELQRK